METESSITRIVFEFVDVVVLSETIRSDVPTETNAANKIKIIAPTLILLSSILS